MYVCVKYECNTYVPWPARPAEAVLCGCHPAGEQHRGSKEQTEDHLQVTHQFINDLLQIILLIILSCNWLVVLSGAVFFYVCVSAESWCYYTLMFWPAHPWTRLTISK